MKSLFASEKNRPVPEDNKNPQNSFDEQITEQQTGSENETIAGLTELYIPEDSADLHLRDIADILLENGKISGEKLAEIRNMQSANQGCDLNQLLLEHKFCSQYDILNAKAQLCGLEFQVIQPETVEKQAFEKLNIDFIKNNSICPVSIQQDTLVVATSEPENLLALEDVKRQTLMDLRVLVCTQENIDKVCEAFKDEKLEGNLDDIISDMTDVEIVQNEKDEIEDLEKMAGQSPVIKFVNYLISNAIHEGASDIHIEPKDKFSKIRCRIDGVLFETKQSPIKMHPAIVSRIKIMSNLDISERRLPQDGKISVLVSARAIDLRVSTLPTKHGEKVVIRILDSNSILRGLESLGMEPQIMQTFSEQIKLPHGILLVTGPTGSGKSTTLYSSLCQMDGSKLNISTVEDPVEYQLEFCNQVQVMEKIGLTFASALRSLLRQDPDIIMIGEIRDQETARIAVQAALTGHLVLSTLHTNDAPSSITRLVNIGVEPYLLAASLNAVLAQRLVRKICPKCKEQYQLPENMKKYAENAGFQPDELLHGAGCDNCRNSGYSGRIGIYELLVIDQNYKNIINEDASINNMRTGFSQSGEPTLFEDGMKKVKQGLTTIEEILRVTEAYIKNENQT